MNAAATLHSRADAAECCVTVAAASNLLLAMHTGECGHFAGFAVCCAIARQKVEVCDAAMYREWLNHLCQWLVDETGHAVVNV
mgnify:CR=1 FL=1